jgi:hypothetical protein
MGVDLPVDNRSYTIGKFVDNSNIESYNAATVNVI